MTSAPIAIFCTCCGMLFEHAFEKGDDYEAGVDEAYCPICVDRMTTPPVVTPVPPEPIHITQMRVIVRDKQAQGVSNNAGKPLFCDMLTASMMILVWDAISPEARAKLETLPLLKQVSICWKLVK